MTRLRRSTTRSPGSCRDAIPPPLWRSHCALDEATEADDLRTQTRAHLLAARAITARGHFDEGALHAMEAVRLGSALKAAGSSLRSIATADHYNNIIMHFSQRLRVVDVHRDSITNYREEYRMRIRMRSIATPLAVAIALLFIAVHTGYAQTCPTRPVGYWQGVFCIGANVVLPSDRA
jgi:hypothetical protein